MFVWWSGGSGGSRIGCCGGLFFLPFAFMTMFGGFGSDGGFSLLLIGIVMVAALFLIPRLMNAPAYAGEKRKNDSLDDYEKPKRDADHYILTDDGEILDVADEDPGVDRSDRSL